MVVLLTGMFVPVHEILVTSWTGFELVYVEVGVFEVYGCYPFHCLESGPYCFLCLHLNFLAFWNSLRLARFSIALHLLFGFRTKNKQL